MKEFRSEDIYCFTVDAKFSKRDAFLIIHLPQFDNDNNKT